MKNILICEEDQEVREALEAELKEMSEYNYVISSDGIMAYQKCRNQEFPCILMSYNTKKLAGLKLIQALRETQDNALSHIIVYTENIQLAKVECQDFRNIEYIQRPCEYSVICDKIDQLANTPPNKKKFRLDVDFVNPFIDSSVKTLNEMCGVDDIHANPPTLLTEELPVDISGNINVQSPFFKGSIALSFAKDVYENIVAKMLEVETNKIDFNTDDGAAEILNVIYGKSKVKLNEYGYKLQRVIPNVIRGSNHKISKSDKTPILVVPFDSDSGKFFIQICVKAI